MPRRPHRPRSEPNPSSRGLAHHGQSLPVDPDLAPDDPSEPSSARRPGAHVRRSRRLDVLGAILLGGFLGALARYEVGLAWPTPADHFPWATFMINTSGALFLGVVLTIILEGPRRFAYLQPFLCVGFTGAWTTMSTFALEVDLLVKHGRVATAVLYVVATVVTGLSASWLGINVARRVPVKGPSWLSR